MSVWIVSTNGKLQKLYNDNFNHQNKLDASKDDYYTTFSTMKLIYNRTLEQLNHWLSLAKAAQEALIKASIPSIKANKMPSEPQNYGVHLA